jgi:hypothetical protein
MWSVANFAAELQPLARPDAPAIQPRSGGLCCSPSGSRAVSAMRSDHCRRSDERTAQQA